MTSQAATMSLGSFTGAIASYSATAVTDNNAAVWNTAASYTITNPSSPVQNGFGGSFKVAWDNNNLYFLVQVNDPNYTKDSDGIEVYLDGNNDKSSSYDTTDWQIGLGQSDYSMAIYQNGSKANPPTFPSYGQFDGSSGYTQLLSVPWSDLNQTASSGSLVGVDVAVIQGAANGKLLWHATTNDDWHNPSLFGTVELSTGGGGGSTPTPAPSATAVPTATSTATPSPTPTGTPSSGGGSLPSPWQDQDIGSVAAAGSASFSSGVYSVNGSGSDIGGSADSFQYAYQSLNGNGTIIARVASMDYPNGYARAGVMIRESLAADSSFAFAGMNVCCGAATEARTQTGGSSSWNPTGSGNVPYWVKLVRSGSTFTSYTSSDGQNWTQVDSQTITMASSVFIGLAVTSYNNGLLEHATFDNVSVTTP